MMKRIPLRIRLIAAFLVAGFVPLLIVGITALGAVDPDERITIATQRWLVPAILASSGVVIVLALLVAFGLTRSITSVAHLLTSLSKEIVDGKLDSRADPSRVGTDFRQVVTRINGLIDIFVNHFNAVSDDLGKIASGIMPDRMDSTYPGDFLRFEENFNRMIDILTGLQTGSRELVSAVRHGELMQRRLWGSLEGVWGELMNGLSELVASFAGILHSLPVPVMMVDRECKIKFANVAAATLVRKRVGEMLGSKSCELLPLDTGLDGLCPAEATMERGAPVTGEGPAEVRGKQMHVMYSSSPMRGFDGALIGAFEIFVDRTELWKAAEQKRVLEEQLARMQRLETVGTLASGLAHDFNNILTCMYAHIHVLETMLPDDEAAIAEFERLTTAIDDASRLIDQILAFSRTVKQEGDRVEVGRIVGETMDQLRGIVPRNITMDTARVSDDIAVIADPVQMRRLVMNLVTNAYQAMQPEGGTLSVSVQAEEISELRPMNCGVLRKGEYCRLTVSDSGQGMEDSVVERMFDPFFTTRPVGEGTGIGLSVVHGIVLKLGGAIHVRSKPGEGSSFDVYIPFSTNHNVVPNQS